MELAVFGKAETGLGVLASNHYTALQKNLFSAFPMSLLEISGCFVFWFMLFLSFVMGKGRIYVLSHKIHPCTLLSMGTLSIQSPKRVTRLSLSLLLALLLWHMSYFSIDLCLS